MDKRGHKRFSVESFCLTVPTHLLHKPFCVSEKFRYRKILWLRERGNKLILRRICFCLTVPKHFLEKLFCVSENFWHPKVLCLRGGGVREYDFPSKLLCLTVPKHFVEEPFCVSESFRYRKILWIRGEYHDFLSKICCLTVPKKNRKGILQCFRKFLVWRKLWIRDGGYYIFPTKKFGLTVPKNFVDISSMFQKNWGIEKVCA